MDAPSPGSVTGWLCDLKAGREVAAQALWNRYFEQLVRVASHRLHGMCRERDGEDIALSALKSAMLGVQNERFPGLTDRTELWPLLVTITARKAINEIKRQRTSKRDRAAETSVADVQQFIGQEPSPDFALRLTEAIETLVAALNDETLRTIAQRKLEGHADDEIASELGVSRRTVVRKLRRIRQEWDEGETRDDASGIL